MNTKATTNSARTSDLSRREFLEISAGVASLGLCGWPRLVGAQSTNGWNQGQVVHLIPTANHERFLIKVSFKAPLTGAPRLSVDGKSVDGVQTDPKGRFWRFDVTASDQRRNTSYGSRMPGARRSAISGR